MGRPRVTGTHIFEPALAGPLRSLCGLRHPTPVVGSQAVLAHQRGHSVDFCDACWFLWADRCIQLSFFPIAHNANDGRPVLDQVPTVAVGNSADTSGT